MGSGNIQSRSCWRQMSSRQEAAVVALCGVLFAYLCLPVVPLTLLKVRLLWASQNGKCANPLKTPSTKTVSGVTWGSSVCSKDEAKPSRAKVPVADRFRVIPTSAWPMHLPTAWPYSCCPGPGPCGSSLPGPKRGGWSQMQSKGG